VLVLVNSSITTLAKVHISHRFFEKYRTKDERNRPLDTVLFCQVAIKVSERYSMNQLLNGIPSSYTTPFYRGLRLCLRNKPKYWTVSRLSWKELRVLHTQPWMCFSLVGSVSSETVHWANQVLLHFRIAIIIRTKVNTIIS
jgi:hypothetical protein